MKLLKNIVATALLSGAALSSFAQNPLITNQFSADPTARVFNGKMYVYPSHDIPYTKGHGRPAWFNMADYHVFSSANLTDWTDHGVIISQPFTFIRGAVVAESEISRLTDMPKSSDSRGWTRGFSPMRPSTGSTPTSPAPTARSRSRRRC